jgi:NADH-quinone oxidoreductase subunit C
MIGALRGEFGAAIEASEEVGRELRLQVAPASVIEVCQFLKGEGYDYPHDLTAVDTGTELHVVYRLVARASGNHAVIRVRAPRAGAVIPSLAGVYRAAEWGEREVYDMFGVRFRGHPDLRRIMLPDDWSGHPLLKEGT